MLATEFGYTYEYIGECMDLPRLTALQKHWKTVPPVSITLFGIASALGMKMPSEQRKQPSLEEAKAVAAMMGPGGRIG